MTRMRKRLWLGVIILLVAALVRILGMGESPPGLQHDEIFKAEEGIRLIEQGDFRIFYPSNQGHEGAFVWFLAVSYAMVGPNILMIKWPALVFGLLTIALLYRFTSVTYGWLVGTVAAGMATVSFWAIYTSRVGLRAVMLPAVALLVLWGLHRLLFPHLNDTRRRWGLAVGTGLALGFAIYTYTASFTLYLAFGTFLIGLLILKPNVLRRHWSEILVVMLVSGLLVLPMVDARLNDPQGLNRAQSISDPLEAFQAGDSAPLLNNTRLLAGMFAFEGDPTWRYNVADRPLFLLPIGLLVYIGVVVALWLSRRKPITILLLLLSVLGLIPSLLTDPAPSYLRSVITLPVVMIFIGLALWQVQQWGRRCGLPYMGWLLGAAVIVVTAMVDLPAYFSAWPANDQVQAIYRDDLQQLAAYLSELDEPVVFASTPNDELDPLIYKYSGAPDDVQVVFFDPFANFVLSDEPRFLFVSPLMDPPISEPHQAWLTEERGTEYVGQLTRQDGEVAFDIYRVGVDSDAVSRRFDIIQRLAPYIGPDGPLPSVDVASWGSLVKYPIQFGDLIQLIGYERTDDPVYTRNSGVQLQLYFRILAERQNLPLNVFVHLMTPDQEVVAQRDLLGVPATQWYPNVLFVQDNFVPIWDWSPIPAGEYLLVLGVYNIETGIRVPIVDGDGQMMADRLFLGNVIVQER